MTSATTRPLLAVAFALLAAVPLQAQQPRDFTPYLITDRAAEVALARSAAPRHVSDSATVLVLERKGFVQAATGTNGFTCAVFRSFAAGVSDPEFWNVRIRAPHCFNPPAARTVLPEMLKRAEWILGGASVAEVAAKTKRAYASREFPMPAVGAMVFMLSPMQHLSDADPHWMPHLMFYYDRSQPAATWGAGDMKAAVIDASAGDAASPVQTLLVPVRQWSNGKTALPAAGH